MNRQQLAIGHDVINNLNEFLLDPSNPAIEQVLKVIRKYGSPEEINERARNASSLDSLFSSTAETCPEYVRDLEWLLNKRDRNSFISLEEFGNNALRGQDIPLQNSNGCDPTLEISALQYFPWIIDEAKRSIESGEVLPGRFIRVRNMKEQEADGDLPAVRAAMKIIGASCVETLDTKGTDGSNIHLGGPETITGYFGGIGQPNDHALRWADEFLYYYTRYGVDQVLNINHGTVFIGYLLYRLGIDIRFKISVFMGNDNPYSVFWTLFMAKLFARPDGSTPLAGFNLSNSIDANHLKESARIRKALGLDEQVRIEHHITETWKSIVIQPYNRREDLLELAGTIPNISAKHEGGDPDDEQKAPYPSDILDYFRTREELTETGDIIKLRDSYLLKHASVNTTARALVKKGIGFIAADKLHRPEGQKRSKIA